MTDHIVDANKMAPKERQARRRRRARKAAKIAKAIAVFLLAHFDEVRHVTRELLHQKSRP